MRILQIYPKSDYFTGAAIQLRELAWGLRDRGHEVIVATRPSATWASKCRDAGIVHHAVPMSSEVDVRSAWRLARILRAHRIEVVHAQKGRGRTLAMLAGLFAPLPVLILNRGVSFPLDRFNRLGYTTRRVTAVVAVCESIKHGLVRSGVPAEKVHVIYSGTDTTRFHPGVDRTGTRRELGITAEDFLVTQIGVRSSKGNDDVIDAMAVVAERAPHVHLLIVGARNSAKLDERARSHGIAARVHVWGYRDDIPEILAASDCCVDASWTGLGLTGTLREALAVETAVIGTDIEGNPELIRHRETGLLVPPRDPKALAEAVVEMIDDVPLRRESARRGRALVEERFSTSAKLARTEALYRELLAARRRRN